MKPPVAVYCDFDGTVTREDVVDVLLADLADPSWQDVEAEWQRGAIGSREGLARQIPLIRGGWSAIAKRLRDMRLDPTFRTFAAWCRGNAIPVRIVSDGLDRVIQTLLTRERIVVDAVWANHLETSPTGEFSIEFPYPPSDPQCRAGLCKCQILGRASAQPLCVVIGDGRSDLCWATRGSWLFAKSELLTYCRMHGISCTAFDDFETIRFAMERLLGDGGAPEVTQRRVRNRLPANV